MEQLRDILIQIAIVILPLFLYETIRLSRYHDTAPRQSWRMTAVISGGIVIFTLMYPIYLGEGHYFDFHTIPIISTYLYGGLYGLFPAFCSLFYHWVLYGLDGITGQAIEVIFISIAAMLTYRKWSTFTRKRKTFISFFLAFLYTLLYFVGSTVMNLFDASFTFAELREQVYFLLVAAAFLITITFQSYLIEYLYENTLLRVEMQKSEKLNIISELAASVAHEVRNPLTVVRGFIQLLQGTGDDKNIEYMRLVLTELDRAENIISDYLDLARPQMEKKEQISLSDLLEEMAKVMSSFATMQGVYLQTEIQKGMYTIGDEAKLKQAIMNIVKNGVEALGGQKGYLKVKAYQRGGEAVVVVKDNGVGMDKEQLARLGQPYYSLKEKGTGLGLMVTFTIIQGHEGRICYKSEKGKGTEATITLPTLT